MKISMNGPELLPNMPVMDWQPISDSHLIHCAAGHLRHIVFYSRCSQERNLPFALSLLMICVE